MDSSCARVSRLAAQSRLCSWLFEHGLAANLGRRDAPCARILWVRVHDSQRHGRGCAVGSARNGSSQEIAIVDLDVHQGDGTATIFQGDDSVFTFDALRNELSVSQGGIRPRY